MTETTTIPKPQEAPSGSAPPIYFPDILMSLIVAFLAPMFLSVTGGDINFARMAAAETVAAYQARNKADLIPIAQVIACGLTGLGSLSLSMADNLSLSMTLRLRGNAVALDRVAEHNRRALREIRVHQPVPHQALETADFTPGTDDALYEAEVLTNLAAARKRTVEAQVRLGCVEPATPQNSAPMPSAATPAPVATPAIPAVDAHKIPPTTTPASPVAAPVVPAAFAPSIQPVATPTIPTPTTTAPQTPTIPVPITATAPAAAPPPIAPTIASTNPTATQPEIPQPTAFAIPPGITDQQWQAMWASAMTDVAGEFTADLENLPPEERRLASRRAASLSDCANQLLSGNVPPRPRPGDLDAIR